MSRLLLVALLLVACTPSNASTQSKALPRTEAVPSTTEATSTTTTTISTTTTTPPEFAVTSPAFETGETIPVEYTCDGEDVSPPLDIVGIPPGTQSLVIIVDHQGDLLGTWDHWVEYDVPANSGSLEIESGTAPLGAQGVNSWNLFGYKGPCPTRGEQQEYSFKVYALSGLLDLPPLSESAVVYQQMEALVIESVELVGLYAR